MWMWILENNMSPFGWKVMRSLRVCGNGICAPYVPIYILYVVPLRCEYKIEFCPIAKDDTQNWQKKNLSKKKKHRQQQQQWHHRVQNVFVLCVFVRLTFYIYSFGHVSYRSSPTLFGGNSNKSWDLIVTSD